MMAARQLPLPATIEARNLGCTCPEPSPGQGGPGNPRPLDRDCPLHGAAAAARDRAAETGPIDTEGDIVDSAAEPELRRSS
jgi:hypothetical protein